MSELLTGTVTFLFSDIEGSTRLLQEQGDAWPGILARHQELLTAAFVAHDGQVVGTEGDSFFVVFPTAPGAVAAAVDAQRALAAEPWAPGAEVHVRMGLHTGEASLGTDTYVGLNVHRASRIASVAHGGQVLVSSVTHALVEEDLPRGVGFRDLGEHRLKDLDRPERLWQLVIEGLPAEFPPIGSYGETPNNLPTRLTSFLGREAEIAAVSSLLGSRRLLTLTGPGGTGKTRLSLEVARRSLGAFPDGVYFVELSTITEPDLVPATIAQALGLPDRGGRTAIERVVDRIGEHRVLLVLDNFEQVLDAAPAVNELLTACPHLAVMTSSRSALHVSGEQEYAVPPLGLPDPRHLPPLDQLSQYEAVALFIERARAVRPGFSVDNDNAPAVAEICVRLDGLPLAIELAAARIRILSPQAMLARIEHRLGLLSGGARDLPERQQTLRGAIAWSHDLLEADERSLFACLSVFIGGAGIPEIERVCGSEVSGDALDVLASLVEKSLVRQSDGVADEPRFGMLETIREFAMEQAVAQGRWDALRERHAELFLSIVDEASVRLMAGDKRVWLDRFEQDHDNLRAALGWAVEHRRADVALRMGAGLWRFWQMRGYLAEGLERLEQALAMEDAAADLGARADALSAAAGITYWQGRSEESQRLYTEEIALRRTLGDRAGLAEALYGISFAYTIVGGVEEHEVALGRRAVEEALEIFRDLGDDGGVGRCEWALANANWVTGEVAEAREHATHAFELFQGIGDEFMIGWSAYTIALADLSDDVDPPDPARRAAARNWLRRALRIFAEAQDVSAYTLVLDALSLVALRDDDRERAARLSGGVRHLEEQTGTGLNSWNRLQLRFDPDALREDPLLVAAWADGEAMDTDALVAYGLADGGPAEAASPAVGPPP